ncbi:MAG: Signal peptidase IB [Nitrospira sp.]|nr:Signal peptidase IB [Nitrospira sp.]
MNRPNPDWRDPRPEDDVLAVDPSINDERGPRENEAAIDDTEWSDEEMEEEEELESTPRRRKGILREVVETVLLALFIYFAVRSLVQNFKVDGSSMEPSLHHGEYLLVNKAAYPNVDMGKLVQMMPWASGAVPTDRRIFPLGTPKRGDIVVFRYPRDPSRDFIKRVVALPGETIEVRGGMVFVNGQKLDEPYELESPNYSSPPTVVPPDQYYVLGDNRNNSSDSHVWGNVPLDHIIGKAWLTYWPLHEWGGIADNPAVLAED